MKKILRNNFNHNFYYLIKIFLFLMKKSILTLIIISIILPIIHITMSVIFRMLEFEFYGNIFTLLKFFLIPMGFKTVLKILKKLGYEDNIKV